MEDPSLYVFVLGRFEVRVRGLSVPPGAWQRRVAARSLLKLLAIQPDHRLHREQILDALWPEDNPSSAHKRFSKALHAARHALEPDLAPRAPSAYLNLTGDVVVLDTATTWIDVDHFDSTARGALESRDPVALEAALASYPGDLLPDERYADWALHRRESLARLHQRVALVCAEEAMARGNVDRAEALWKDVLGEDPTLEEAHRALMRLYAQRDARSLALRQYGVLKETLEAELGIEPDPATTRLYEEIARGEHAPVLQSPPMPTRPMSPHPAVGPPPTIPTIGRESALALLRQDLAMAEQGSFRLALLSGVPGIGKTRLMADVAREATDRGFAVLWGKAGVLGREVAWGALAQALEQFTAGCSEVERKALALRHPLLARLVPSLRQHAEHIPATPADEAFQGWILTEITALLRELARESPLLVAIDDLHTADDATLEALRAVSQIDGEYRCLVLATCLQGGDRGTTFARLLASFRRDSIGHRITLRRLSLDDTANLVRYLLPGGTHGSYLLHRLYAHSLGNPLMVEETVRALRDEGQLHLTDGAWTLDPDATFPVSDRLDAMVLSRVEQHNADARAVLQLASVHGERFPFATLCHAIHLLSDRWTEERLLDVLDRVTSSEFLESHGEVYAFHHPLIRSAILDHVPDHRRRRLHGLVARALEAQRPDDVDALAHHYMESGEPLRAVPYVRDAGDRASALGAHDVAAVHYAALVQALEQLPSHQNELPEARRKLGWALAVRGRYAEALDELERADSGYQALGDAAGHALAAAQIGHVLGFRGEIEEGLRRVRGVLADGAQNIPDLGRAGLQVALAALLWHQGEYERQLEAADLAEALLGGVTDDAATSIRIPTLAWRGVALIALERGAEGVATLETVLSAAERLGNWRTASRAANTLSAYYQEKGDVKRYPPYLERALAAAERLGDPVRLSFMLNRRGWHLYTTGHWKEARSDFERGLDLNRDAGGSWVGPYLQLGLASLKADEEDWREAVALARQCLARGAQIDPQVRWAAQSVLARCDLGMGRPAEVNARLDPLHTAAGLSSYDHARLYALQAEAHLACGDLSAAVARLNQAMAQPGIRDALPDYAEVLRVRALLALERHDTPAARAAATKALRIARRTGNPFAIARNLRALGMVDAAAGQTADAISNFKQALATFEEIGATSWARRLRRDLRACRASVSA